MHRKKISRQKSARSVNDRLTGGRNGKRIGLTLNIVVKNAGDQNIKSSNLVQK